MNSTLPLEKSLRVMEALQCEPERRFSLTEIARETGVPVSTAQRILGILKEHGYLHRRADKTYTVNFILKKTLPMSTGSYNRLLDILQWAASETNQSAELLSIQGDYLYWHERRTAPEQKIRIRAEAGFRRSLYELDAPSRLYLSCLGCKAVEQRFNTAAFYLSGPDYQKLSWPEAHRCIENTDASGIAYDFEGNSNGVRRFAGLLFSESADDDCPLICIICIAEAAIPTHNRDEHIRHTVEVLQTALRQTKESLS